MAHYNKVSIVCHLTKFQEKLVLEQLEHFILKGTPGSLGFTQVSDQSAQLGLAG